MKKFLNLGFQPLANSYLEKKNLNKRENKFELIIMYDNKNYLVSILNKVSKKKMFNENYPYKSSESLTMRKSFKNLAKFLKRKFKPKFILEIGSNDGAFLKNFKKKEIIGIEPCKNLANITKKKGFKVYSNYWNTDLAKKIFSKKKIDLIYSANTLSHIENYDELFKAIKFSLNDSGILVLEDPSLLECIKNVAYDQFYCEHIYVFSTISLKKILDKYDMEIYEEEKNKTNRRKKKKYKKKKKKKNNK